MTLGGTGEKKDQMTDNQTDASCDLLFWSFSNHPLGGVGDPSVMPLQTVYHIKTEML